MSFKKRIMVGIITVVLVVSGVPVMAMAAEDNNQLIDESGNYVIGDYWTVKTKKAPTKEGYVFGGWYEKEGDNFVALKESELSDDAVKNMTAYPKFVPDEVLSVKTQMGTKGKKTSLRLLSTVDSTEYQYVGFMYQLGSGSVGNKKMDKVFSAIQPSKDSEALLYPEQEFSAISEYFVAADVSNIAERNFDTIIYARPYWITMDGTRVLGLARNNRVEDKVNDYTSVPINLLTDGKVPAEMAAGMIGITYNTENYDVVVGEDNKIDYGKLLPEMECSVDEANGKIVIVGNASKVNENVLADGILANVRFVKSSDATSDNLDFTITSASFCDWDENKIDTNIFIR